MMFTAGSKLSKTRINENHFLVTQYDEVETTQGWVKSSDLQIGDVVTDGNDYAQISNIVKDDLNITVYVVNVYKEWG